MDTKKKFAPTQTSATGRYNVVQPVEREGSDKTFWLRVGTAFENPGKNGEPGSISVLLDALPLGGKVVLFPDTGERQGE